MAQTNVPVPKDFNVVIQILDDLTEDRWSFTEMDDSLGRIFGRDSIIESLHFLNGRGLISIVECNVNGLFQTITDKQSIAKIDEFFTIARLDRESSVRNFAELNERGWELMRTLGIGCL